MTAETFNQLLREVRACRLCADKLSFALLASARASPVLVVGFAAIAATTLAA